MSHLQQTIWLFYLKLALKDLCLHFSFHLPFLCCLDMPSLVMEPLGSTEEKHCLMHWPGFVLWLSCCCRCWIWNWHESSQQFSSNFNQMPFQGDREEKIKVPLNSCPQSPFPCCQSRIYWSAAAALSSRRAASSSWGRLWKVGPGGRFIS